MCFKAYDRTRKIINFDFELEEKVVDEDVETTKESLDPIDEGMKKLNR
jgi:hypothetical protein